MQPQTSTNSHPRSPEAGHCATLGNSLLGTLLVSMALCACERTALTDGMPDNADRCGSCHGTPGNPAPPYALNGSWDTNYVGVGAHQQHLVASDIAGAVPCYECHPIPTELLTHPNWSGQPTAVTFGPRASINQPTPASGPPTWDRTTAICRNVYCHGATLSGADSRAAPLWTRVDGSQRGCTACHGFPPVDAVHQNATACQDCHGAVVGPGQSIVNPALHVNGAIDIGSAPASGTNDVHAAGLEPEGVAW
jgi:predicted CxxxxCH...CXXCH cytochrome family protein